MLSDSKNCFGYYSSKQPKCQTCSSKELCSQVLHKKRLEPILAKIQDVEKTLKGEKLEQAS